MVASAMSSSSSLQHRIGDFKKTMTLVSTESINGIVILHHRSAVINIIIVNVSKLQ